MAEAFFGALLVYPCLSQVIADGRGLSFVVTPLSDWITAVGVALASEIRDLEYQELSSIS
jgi:hypothetical protein